MNDEASNLMLVIEDSPEVSGSIQAYFEDYEYRVLVAGDGTKGMGMFDQHHPAVVLVDLNLPGLNGLEILQRVRAESPETPVLVISGSGIMGDVVQALRLGAWDYHIKPIVDLSTLRYAVERALERARLLRENREYRERLEEQVRERTSELEQANRSLHDKNVALREVLTAVEAEKSAVGQNVVSNIDRVVLPILHTVRQGVPPAQQKRLDQVESSLREIASPFADKLARDSARLSPMELRITLLIRRGLSMKEIASMENISPETVSTHRRAIRRKLGITNKKMNLASYLDAYLQGETDGTSQPSQSH